MEKGTKIALALAGAASVTAAVVYWPKKASAAQGPGGGGGSLLGGGGGPAPVTKDSGTDLIAACADGTKEGTTDGNKDGASLTSKMPSPRLTYSTNTVVQAKFEECYQNAYGKAFDVTSAVVKAKGTTAYSGPKPEEVTAAYQSGKDAGTAQGQADADAFHAFQIDFSRVPAGYRTQPSTLALAKPWQDGYNAGYSSGFSTRSGISKSTEYGSASSDDTTDSTTGVGGVGRAVLVGGRMIPSHRIPARAGQTLANARPVLSRPTSSAMALPRSSAMAIPGKAQEDTHGLLIAIRKPMEVVTAVAELPIGVAQNVFGRMRDVGQHIYTKGVVGGALSSRGYYK